MLVATTSIAIAVGLAQALLSAKSSHAANPQPIPALRETPKEPTKPRALEWIEIRRPVQQFALDTPQADRALFQQKLFRNAIGEREETITWGAPSTPTLYAQITIHHGGEMPMADDGLVVTAARRAAANGLAITRMAAATGLPTKFGELETADAQLQNETAERSCLVFRYRRADSSFGLAGWYCGSVEKPAEPAALACFIDRLDLVAAGDDVQLQQIFATAERQRGRCPGARRLTSLDFESRAETNWPVVGPPMPVNKVGRRVPHRRSRN